MFSSCEPCCCDLELWHVTLIVELYLDSATLNQHAECLDQGSFSLRLSFWPANTHVQLIALYQSTCLFKFLRCVFILLHCMQDLFCIVFRIVFCRQYPVLYFVLSILYFVTYSSYSCCSLEFACTFDIYAIKHFTYLLTMVSKRTKIVHVDPVWVQSVQESCTV